MYRKIQKLPLFFIIGVPKAGTTSLYYYLKKHPKVFLPEVKEPHFFSFMNESIKFQSPDRLNDVITDLNKYRLLFANASHYHILGEASTSYLYNSNKVISNIKKVYGPNIYFLKFIVILRNPLDRMISQYNMFKREGFEELPMEEAFDLETISYRLKNNWNIYYDYVGFSIYYPHLKEYLREFGEENVLILFYDDLKENISDFMHRIFSFLQIDNIPIKVNIWYNKSGNLKNNLLAKTAYRLLFKENSLKKILKPIVPKYYRLLIRHLITNYIFEHNNKVSVKINKHVLSMFLEDIHSLIQLFENLNIRSKIYILDRWIKQIKSLNDSSI